jgi:hypothetical protein
MDLEQKISKFIKEEAEKLITRHHNRTHLDQIRNEK